MRVFFGLILCVEIFLTIRQCQAASIQKFVTKDSLQSGDTSEDVANTQTLKLVQVIFRHGDRTPLSKYPNDPYTSLMDWPEGLGMLTQKGKYQQNTLGEYIRKRYSGFLSETYTPEEIHFQSSALNRTISSAKANIAGMWPEDMKHTNGTPFQNFIPVHVLPAELDDKLLFTRPCPRYSQIQYETGNSTSETAFNLQHAELYAHLSKHTGLNVTNAVNVYDIYELLFAEQSQNLTLPEWTKEVYPDMLKSIAERALMMQWVASTKEMHRLTAGPLLTELVKNIRRAAGNMSKEELDNYTTPPPSKFYVYSGHDTTLIALLEAMGAYTGEIPHYASSLYFELHQGDQPTQYYVKVFYRPDWDKPAKELTVRGCKPNPCSLVDFVNTLSYFIIDDDKWVKECSLDSS